MSLAADTRRAAGNHPFLRHALRAGVCNYTAAARFLDVDGDTDAVATALRRYAEDLSPINVQTRDVRVTMQSGVGPVENPDDAQLVVGDTAFGPADGDRTTILATGDVDAAALAATLDRLLLDEVPVSAAAFEGETLVLVVDRRDGANALRAVERGLESVPQ